MRRHRHWILRGRNLVPVDLMTWARWLETDRGARIVAQWDFGDSHVSTVFLGLDHNFGDKGPPLLFETMVFGGPMDGEQRRYATYDEAEVGHMEVCKQVAARVKQEMH